MALSGTISEQLYKNEIEISMRAMLTAKNATTTMSQKTQKAGRFPDAVMFPGLYNAISGYRASLLPIRSCHKPRAGTTRRCFRLTASSVPSRVRLPRPVRDCRSESRP